MQRRPAGELLDDVVDRALAQLLQAAAELAALHALAVGHVELPVDVDLAVTRDGVTPEAAGDLRSVA